MTEPAARLPHDVRRRQVLACASRLFAERGYAPVSMTAVAREAGVARGLVNHYFGSKHGLYLEVVREMVRLPPPLPSGERDEQWATWVDRWLDLVERHREAWFAAIGAKGLGSDPELEAIVDDAREAATGRVIALIGAPDTPEVRALVRSYGDMAEGATREWLRTARLTRDQLRALLEHSLPMLIDQVLPLMADAPTTTGGDRMPETTRSGEPRCS